MAKQKLMALLLPVAEGKRASFGERCFLNRMPPHYWVMVTDTMIAVYGSMQ